MVHAYSNDTLKCWWELNLAVGPQIAILNIGRVKFGKDCHMYNNICKYNIILADFNYRLPKTTKFSIYTTSTVIRNTDIRQAREVLYSCMIVTRLELVFTVPSEHGEGGKNYGKCQENHNIQLTQC